MEDDQDTQIGPMPRPSDHADDSDCEIQEPHISVIDLNDSLDESEAANEQTTTSIIDSPVQKQPDNGVLFTVLFGDRDKFDCLRDFVKDAIKSCLDERSVCVDMIEDETNLSFRAVEKLGPENITDLIFSIDTTPATKPEINAIPSYKRSVRDVFNDEKKIEVDEDECPKRLRMSQTCFNCSGSHSLKDCTEPKNQQRINKARKMFTSKQERYHVDIEQRFAHLRPGQITSGLRKAMGLRNAEIPPFIYRMRILGYPPGWLEEAKVAHSGLTLFDSEGRQVQGSDGEDGELDEFKHKYDVRKIISFPGFNCEPDADLIEDRRMPPMLPENQKDVFIKSLGENIEKGYKRKKMKSLIAIEPEKQIVADTMDMEIEDDNDGLHYPILTAPLPPPLPDDIQPHPPPEEAPPPPITRPSRKHRKSPSLEDLEAKQRKIMEALDNPTSLLDGTADDSLIDEILEVQNMIEDDRTASPLTINGDTQATTISSASNGTNSTELHGTPTQNNAINKDLSVLGTPVLKFSPFDKLPTGDQFSKGVSDVINFENLPDSTGKYEKMTLVIDKVRKAVIKSNEEN